MSIIIRSITNNTPYTLTLKVPGIENNLAPIIVAPSVTLDLLSVVTEDDLIAMQLYLQGMVDRGSLSVAATFDTATLESGYEGGGGSVTFPLLAPNGVSGTPSYSFTNMPTSGMWLDFNNNYALTLNGHVGGPDFGGDIRLEAGDGSSLDGSVYLTSGSQSGFGGAIIVTTGDTERLRIGSHGAWKLNGSTAGNTGDVLTSNGSGNPPAWSDALKAGPIGDNVNSIGAIVTGGSNAEPTKLLLTNTDSGQTWGLVAFNTNNHSGGFALVHENSGHIFDVNTSNEMTLQRQLSLSGNPINNVSDPSNPSDAATKNYVDGTTAPISRTISTTAPIVGGGDLSADRTLSIPVATNSSDGYLSSTDWNTFNNKQSSLGYTPVNQAGDTMTGALGIGESPDASAILDVASTTLGFLPPRMTSAQRDAIISPAEGLTIYNNEDNQINYFDGGVWVALSTGTGNIPGSTNGAVQFNDSGSFGGDASNLFWDATNDRLGIGTNAPSVPLHVVGNVLLNGQVDLNSHKIVNVTDPASAQDVATKNYVDSNFTLKVASAALTGQNTDISSTPLFTPSVTGTYQVSVYLVDTAASLSAGAVQANITYTDDSGAQTYSTTPIALTTLGTKTNSTFFIEAVSGNVVSYSTSHTGIFSTSAYSIYVSVVRLS